MHTHAVVKWGSLDVLTYCSASNLLPILGRKRCGPISSFFSVIQVSKFKKLTYLEIAVNVAVLGLHTNSSMVADDILTRK